MSEATFTWTILVKVNNNNNNKTRLPGGMNRTCNRIKFSYEGPSLSHYLTLRHRKKKRTRVIKCKSTWLSRSALFFIRTVIIKSKMYIGLNILHNFFHVLYLKIGLRKNRSCPHVGQLCLKIWFYTKSFVCYQVKIIHFNFALCPELPRI